MKRTLPLCAAPLFLLACGQASPPYMFPDMGGGTPPPSTATVEKRLTLKLALKGTTLQISARDGGTPVMTDLWLYTLEGAAVRPFGDFADPDSARRSRRRLMPCKLAGMPSGLYPCDEGEENGLMTDAASGALEGGQLTSAIDGDVEVKLNAAPKGPLLVVAAVEDQRYAGAAAIDAAGQAIAAPPGLGQPATIKPRTYSKDVAPILQRCGGCHGPGGPADLFRLRSYEDIVERNFGYEEEKADCEEQFPADAQKRAECIAAITAVEYMVERGAPVLSPLLRRTRPDEMKSVSPTGLIWYGRAGSRFGDHGDRRMPPQNITPDLMDDMATATHFDNNPADFQILFDWVAQGAPK